MLFRSHGIIWIGAAVLGLASLGWVVQAFRRKEAVRIPDIGPLRDALALFVVLLVWAAKRAGFWWAKLSDWLKQKWADEPLQEGFVDEKKKLIDWEEWRDLRMERLRQWGARHFEREPGWDDFADDKARVRHAYGRLLRGWLSAGREHKPHLTPAETGREMASAGKLDPAGEATIRLYERVRYGDKQPEVSELEPIRNLFGKRIK